MSQKSSPLKNMATGQHEEWQEKLCSYYAHSFQVYDKKSRNVGICYFTAQLSTRKVQVVQEVLRDHAGMYASCDEGLKENGSPQAAMKHTNSCQVTVEERMQLFQCLQS